MKAVARLTPVVLAVAAFAAPAAGQQHGNVVYVSPKHGTGLSIIGDFARGLNDASAKTNYFGGRAILGLPMLTVSAGAGVVKPSGAASSDISFGGNVSVNVISAPLLPVAVAIHGGVGYLSEGGVTQLQFPIGVALAVRVPSPGVSVEPWIAPRLHVSRVSGTGFSGTEVDFGASGGVNVGLPMGLGFHAAFDYLMVDSGITPIIVGVGVHYKISVPGLGMM